MKPRAHIQASHPEMVDKMKRAKSAELSRTIDRVCHWVENNLETKNPEQANMVYFHLEALMDVAMNTPEESHAALLGAKAMWHMLFTDAWTGFGVRHGRKPLPETADADTIRRYLEQAHRDFPDEKRITELRKKVCEAHGIGRSTLLEKTKYNPLKK